MARTGAMTGGGRLRRLKSRNGQALVEYALILALVSVLSISVLNSFGQQVHGIFMSIIGALSVAGHGF